jgi:hypothetical protein
MVTIPPIHCENGDRLFLDRMAWPTQRRSQWKDNSLNGCWITNRSSLISIYIYIIYIYMICIYIYINLLKSEFGSIYWNLSLEELWGIFPVEKKNCQKRISSSPGGNIKNPAEPGAMWAGGDRKENRLFPASDGLCPWRADLTVDMWYHVVTFRSKTWVAWTRNEATGGSATSSTM